MERKQPYIELEGELYWYSSESDGISGKQVHTYVTGGINGEIRIKSPTLIETGRTKRIIVLNEYRLNRPIVTKELMGTTFEHGSFTGFGTVVDTIPENGIDIKPMVEDAMKPAEVDHTLGKGTIWEQLSNTDADDGEDYYDEYPDPDYED